MSGRAMFDWPVASDREDPRNRVLAVGALVVAAVMMGVVMFVQSYVSGFGEERREQAPASVAAREDVEPPGIDELTISAKRAVSVATNERVTEPRTDGMQPRVAAAGPALRHDVGGRYYEPSEHDRAAQEEVDREAATRTERVRAAVVAAELLGVKEGKRRLGELAREVDASGELAADIAWFERLYANGSDAISQKDVTTMIQRHGWFARLALTFDRPIDDRLRVYVLSVDDGLVASVKAYIVIVIITFFVGFILAIVGIVLLSRGELTGQFDAPAVGGPVYLEVFGAFLIGFVVVQMLNVLVLTQPREAAVWWMVVREAGVWGLFSAAAYPLLRGVSLDALRLDLGWHIGAGVGREVACGVVGFVASVPVDWGVRMLIKALDTGSAAGADQPSGHPMFREPVELSWGVVILGTLSAVVWAPVVEETIFRGALYRYVRPYVGWAGGVAIVSLAFGLVHPYGWQGMLQVGVMGVILGLLREWRGSLIAPMVAHSLHNLMIWGLIVMKLWYMGD